MRKTLLAIIFLFLWTHLDAEMIYLKDGQVLKGRIVRETNNEITVRTRFQTKRIRRGDIIRIMYGERKMEKIYLLMKDGTTRTGFLVDQDASKVIIREKEDSAEEITIGKSGIKQMSTSGEIIPLNPSIRIRGGYFYPLNSRGAKLKPARSVFAGSDMNIQFIRNTRLILEAGYIKSQGESEGLTMRFIPLTAGLMYDLPLGSFHLVPRLSVGTSIIDFNDGEGETSRSFAFASLGGIGLTYELLDRHLYAGLWPEYTMMRDGKGTLHTITVSLGITYRL